VAVTLAAREAYGNEECQDQRNRRRFSMVFPGHCFSYSQAPQFDKRKERIVKAAESLHPLGLLEISRLRCAFVILLLAVVGCGKSEPPLLQTLTTRYEGITADQWYERLLDADYVTRSHAAVALSNIGEESLPFFVLGLQSDRTEIRVLCADALPGVAKHHAAEFSPLIVQLLHESALESRQAATNVIGNLKWLSLIPELETARDRESNATLKKHMSVRLEKLKKATA
jgi:hypothetical protein